MATFPITPRYFITFRHSDTGLTPTFTYFKNSASLANVTPPSIVELQNGRYYFDWTFTTKSDPDIVFEIDGGSSIPTEEVRFPNGQLSPRDRFIDEPTSQVVTDVWTDVVSYSAGQKGKRVDQLGDPTDASSASTMFGKELLYKEAIRGDTAGASDGNNVKQVYDRVGIPIASTLSTDIAAVQTTANAINSKIGTPGSTVSVDIAGIQTKLGTPAGASVSADIASLATGNSGLGTSISALSTKVGTPAGASVSADIAAVKSDTAAIKLKTDTIPASPATTTDVSAVITAIQGTDARDLTQIAGSGFSTTTMSLSVVHSTLLRVAGMLHENSVLDGTQFDSNNNLTSGRLRLYDSKAHSDAALGVPWPGVYDTGKIAEYYIQATYTGSNLQTYEVSRVA